MVRRALRTEVHRVWVGLSFLLGAVFLVLVGLGDRLGDPEKIAELRWSGKI